jgi:hypothetical protein
VQFVQLLWFPKENVKSGMQLSMVPSPEQADPAGQDAHFLFVKNVQGKVW